MLAGEVHGRDAKKQFGEAAFAVVPLGSLEYHGPHSPLGTDLYLAQGFAERIDPSLKPLIYPAVPYSACPGKTSSYPGTITIDPPVFHRYLEAVLDGICRSGIQRVVLLNAHDGNMGAARTTAEQVTARWKDASFLLINWWQMAAVDAPEKLGFFQGTTGRGHGGPYEMSALKALRPDLVEVRREDRDLTPPEALSEVPYVLVEGTPRGWDGYTGNIHQISLETGEWIAGEVTANMNKLIASWLTSHDITD
ncbi:creatininase family protein [Paenibacillus sp. FJAT-26967]|uniref:creatininase family protein n=1 Tax=Paenibacillus sp. FJAT-26967 TaxID=1729690 RepID=UPI0008389A95|nr:creatininase family protein [Paenibacillus sp. FJAT-26967]